MKKKISFQRSAGEDRPSWTIASWFQQNWIAHIGWCFLHTLHTLIDIQQHGSHNAEIVFRAFVQASRDTYPILSTCFSPRLESLLRRKCSIVQQGATVLVSKCATSTITPQKNSDSFSSHIPQGFCGWSTLAKNKGYKTIGTNRDSPHVLPPPLTWMNEWMNGIRSRAKTRRVCDNGLKRLMPKVAKKNHRNSHVEARWN